MKRFLSIVLALCMVFALCACGNDSNNGGSDADSSKYDKISIDLSCNGQSDTANDCIGANLFKQYIEEQSGGAITVTIYNNDQLAGGNIPRASSWLWTAPSRWISTPPPSSRPSTSASW